jgi:DnaJ-class molecular chaperone
VAVKFKDYYEVLGVPKTANEKEIKAAYRKLARKWHPDANPKDTKSAEEKFKEIQEAFEVLGDVEKRRKYDALGNDWDQASQRAASQPRQPRGEPDVGANNFSDFFDAYFSDVGRRRTASSAVPLRGADLEGSIEVSLRDAYAGGTRSVSLTLEDTCPRCGGSGVVQRSVCPVCHGIGRVATAKTLEISVPRGVRNGQRIRLGGQGGRGIHDGPPGDLFLEVLVQDDTQFERDGDDITFELRVNVYTLILGGEVRVPTLSGDVTMTIPPETQNEQVLRLTGKGMPRLKKRGFGDEYVRVSARLPQQLAPRERELYRELAAFPRAGVPEKALGEPGADT